MLISNLINLGVYNEVYQILKESGKDIVQIEEFEPEPSLGNGGLGRLAACFLDSIASLGTMDGANVEIANLVGSANIYTFGKDSNTIIDLYKTSGYKAIEYYNNPVI